MLDPHRLERPRVEAEQLQDARGDLGRLDGCADLLAVPQAGQRDQDRDVAVLRVVAAVLGDLRRAAGVDDAVREMPMMSGTRGSDHGTPMKSAADLPAYTFFSPEAVTVIGLSLMLLPGAECVSR